MRPTEDGRTPDVQRVREALRALEGVRPGRAFRESLKRAFVSGSIAERKPPAAVRGFPWKTALQFAFVFVLVLGAWLVFELRGPTWKLVSVSGHGQIQVNGETADVDDAVRLGRLLEAHASIRVGADASLTLVAGDLLLLELAPDTELTLPASLSRVFSGSPESVLRHGELRLMTGPGFSGRSFAVRTAEGRTELTGTVLSVYEGDGFTCVCVWEGTARIGKDAARMEAVSAGFRKVMFHGDKPSLVTDIEPHHEEGLLKFVERNSGAFQ